MMGQREIGGYFELEAFQGEHYRQNALPVSCGRAALELFAELRRVKSILVPDWMCSCVPDLFSRLGIRVCTYVVGADFRPVYDFEVGAEEWMLLMDYYGQLNRADVERALEASGGRLVADETQGFFRDPWEDADTVYTCRKFFGVPDGGYLVTRAQAAGERDEEAEAAHAALEPDESHGRMGFVFGRYERLAGEFFAEACDNNELFDHLPARRMSPVTDNLLRAIDYGIARKRREENFAYLHERLGKVNLLEVVETQGPFMYPLLVDDASSVRRRMAGEDIFIPTLWPNVLGDQPKDSIAYRYAENILPLPIDQRYGFDDMERVLKGLAQCNCL